MARFLQRFSPNSQPIQSEPGWRADVGNVMNKDSNGTFGIIIGGVVAVIAAIFILSGGELGGKKTVEGDQDLPPVATTDR
jgi:tetrahydromethanopterin S-methyltransferase subunit B